MNLRVNALRARYQAERMSAIANLEVYLKNPVGVGEHQDIVESMNVLITTIADMDGRLAVLDNVISENTAAAEEDQINS